MNVEIQLFAAARDLAGASSVRIELPAQATVADLKSRLIAEHPNLESVAKVLLVAVDNEYAAEERVLTESDRVVCFPPVSGG